MRRSIPQRETSSTGLSKPVTVRCLSLSQSLTHKKQTSVLTISSSALFRVVFTSSTKTSCALLLLCFCRPPNSLPATLQKTANTASVSFADENQQNRATEASDSALSAFSSQSPRDPVRGAMSLPSSTSLSPSSPLHSFSLRAVIGTLQRLFLLRGKLRGLTLVVLETGMDGRMSWTLSVLFFFFLFSSFSHTYDYSGQGRYPQRSDYPSPSFIAHHRPLFSDSIQTRPRKTAHPHLYPASRRGRLYPLPSSRRHVLPSPDCSRP